MERLKGNVGVFFMKIYQIFPGINFEKLCFSILSLVETIYQCIRRHSADLLTNLVAIDFTLFDSILI
jgi:hypothetical protein